MSTKEPRKQKTGRAIGGIASQWGTFGSPNGEDEVTSTPGSQQTSTPAKQDTSKPVEQQTSKLVSQQAVTPANQQNGLPVPQEASTPALMKATYYITPEQDMKLERIRLARRGEGRKMDKSALIREAINLLQE